MLKRTENPLFLAPVSAADVAALKSPTIHKRQLQTERRKLTDARRAASAIDALVGLDRTTEIFGFTKGQFSLLDMIAACLRFTGPAHLSISTWTAASHELQMLAAMVARGDITGTRWLIDFSMARRETQITAQLREAFGQENIRVAQNHAKWCVFQNAEWKLVLRSSMNLNMNPRFEDFQIAHDPELADFLNAILDEIWAKQAHTKADAKPYDIVKHFADEL